jgi:hypothetical protein
MSAQVRRLHERVARPHADAEERVPARLQVFPVRTAA